MRLAAWGCASLLLSACLHGFLKLLRTDLSPSDSLLLLLYQRGARGATRDQLASWARPEMRSNLRRTLER